MVIMRYQGGPRAFHKLRHSVLYVEKDSKKFQSFGNSWYGKMCKEHAIFRHYSHFLYVGFSKEEQKDFILKNMKRGEGENPHRGIFRPMFMTIEYPYQALSMSFSPGIAISDKYKVSGRECAFLRPFRMSLDLRYDDLSYVIYEAQEKFIKEMRPRLVGTVSPFYILQFRKKGLVEVMFFVGGDTRARK